MQVSFVERSFKGKIWTHREVFPYIQFSSVTQLCATVWNPMDRVHQQLPELAQTHVHWVSDTIQPSHLLLSPSTPGFNLSQHQGLFQWVSSLHKVAKVLEFQWIFQWIFRNIQDWFPLRWTGWISLLSKGLSGVFSNTTVQKHQFFDAQLFFIVQLSYPYTTTEKTIALTRQTLVGKVI